MAIKYFHHTFLNKSGENLKDKFKIVNFLKK